MSLRKKFWKLKEALARKFDPDEREFLRVYPSIDKVEGFLKSPMQERWFFKTARNASDHAVIVEIGSFKGRSTVSFGFGCLGTSKHIFAIDLFEGDGEYYGSGDFQRVFEQNLESCGVRHHVTPLKIHSLEAAKTWSMPIDILFIDGSHEYEDVKADFEAFYPLVKRDGIIAFHDIKGKWEGVKRYWKEVKDSGRLQQIGTVSSLGFGRKV